MNRSGIILSAGIRPSPRGKLEITAVDRVCLDRGLRMERMGSGLERD